MRSYILLAAIFAVAVNADGHKDEERHHDGNHREHHSDWADHEMNCMMMGGWGCDSAVTVGATATVFAATLAALI